MARWVLVTLTAWIAAVPATGGEVRVRPIEPLTQGVTWVDEETLALLVELRWLDRFGEAVTGIALQSVESGETRWIRLPHRVVGLKASEDGRRLVAATDAGTLLYLDPADGRVERVVEVDVRGVGLVEVVGAGDRMRVLVTLGSEARVYDAAGAEIDAVAIHGTTPTITRVYHGGEELHDNILEDSPTWIVSGALSAGGRYLAVGGSDSVVRLFDRQAGTVHELSFEWSYEERRLMGGNPDLNQPLALRFVDGTLVGVFVHGDILRWDAAAPQSPPTHLPGTCSDDELDASRARFGTAQPWDDVSDFGKKMARQECAYAYGHGALTRDGAAAVTRVSTGLRVRDALTGQTRVQLIDSSFERPIPDWGMAVSAEGTLALVDLYGSVAIWTADGGLRHHVLRSHDLGGVQRLSADGKRLTMNADPGTDAQWDLDGGGRTSVPSVYVHGAEVAASRALLQGRIPDGVRDQQTAVSADGRTVAWIEGDGQQRSKVTCVGLGANAGFALAVVEVAGWPGTIGLSPDGAEVLYTLQDGTAVRWRPAEKDQEVVQRNSLMLAQDIRYLPGSTVIALIGYRSIVLVRDDEELTELATLYALRDGEWVLISVDGTIQTSSAQAVASLLTVVTDDAGGITLHDGDTGWQRFATDDLWARIVMGSMD